MRPRALSLVIPIFLFAGCREEPGRCSDSERPCVQIEREVGGASLLFPTSLALTATRDGEPPRTLPVQASGVEDAFRERGHYTLELDTAPARLALHADALRNGQVILSGDATYEPGSSPRPLALRLQVPKVIDRPFITKIFPESGPTSGGTLLQLVGGGFRNSPTLRVLFGDTPVVPPGFVDGATLKPSLPPGKFGPVDVVVESEPGVRSAPVRFRYYCGSITFRDSGAATVSNTDRPQAVAAGDVNGDGIPDAVVAVNGTGTEGPVVVYKGVRDQSGYRLSYLGAPWTGAAASAVAVGRLDGDTLDDVVTLEAQAVRVLLQQGGKLAGPGIRTPITLANGTTPTLTSMVLAKLDGDDYLDLAITASLGPQSTGWLVVLYGDGTGNFPKKRELEVGYDPRGVVALKLDGDGINDLIVANNRLGNLSVSLGRADGSLGAITNYQSGVQSPVHLATGFADAGDSEDLVISGQNINGQPAVAVLLNDGTGRISAASLPPTLTPAGSFAALADLDGDGNGDVISYGAAASQLIVWRGTGDGKTFPMAAQLRQTTVQSALTVADLDGDQHPDLLLVSTDGRTLRPLYQTCP